MIFRRFFLNCTPAGPVSAMTDVTYIYINTRIFLVNVLTVDIHKVYDIDLGSDYME